MFIKIKDEEFEFNTKLGTTFKIEESFKKPYLRVLSNIDNMTAMEQIKMLSCGLNTKEDKDRLKNAIAEEGLGVLSDILEEFIDELQYPGLSEEEREQKKLQKVAKQKRMREIGLMN